jgi:tetratricopeptide (TPR) repeat protein
VLGLGIDLVFLYFLVKIYPNYDLDSVVLLLTSHALACSVSSWGIFSYHPIKWRMGAFIFVFLLSVPIFGYIGVIQMLTVRNDEVSNIFIEFRRHIKTGAKSIIHTKKNTISMSQLKEGMELTPVSEVLETEKEYTKKLAIIRNLGKISNPNSVAALKNLLIDPHMDVRYYAGEELALIEEHYNIFINELKKNIIADSQDYKSRFELGSILMEYAFSGLLDDNAKHEELENARTQFMKSLEINPDQVEAMLLLGRLYVYFSSYDSALNHFNTALIRDNDCMTALLGCAECYWNKKDIISLYGCMRKIETLLDYYDGEDRDNILELLSSWRISDEYQKTRFAY